MNSWPRRHRGWLITLGVLLVVLIGVRLALPSIIKKIVETKLETMPGGYQGTVPKGVDVRLLQGEIGMTGFTIKKKNGLIPVPFMQMKEFVLGFEWDGWKLRNFLRFVQPNASFVDAESEAKKQKGPEKTIETLRQKLPLELIRVEVIDGTFHFRNYQTKPDMDLAASGLNLTWDKLFGCLPPGFSACRSNLKGRAKLLKSGDLNFQGTFKRTPESKLHLIARVRDLRAPELNPFLTEYVKVKMSKGVIELDVRYDIAGERKDALIIPLLDDIEVTKAEGEDKSFLRKLGVGVAAGWFERKKGDKGIAIHKKASGDTDFEIVDKPSVESADKAD